MKIKSRLFVSVGMCLMAGFLGSIATYRAIPTWYSTLEKPWFTPPAWLFGPVWTALYILMGISFYLIWNTKKKHKKTQYALRIFLVQLGLNIVWSILFFGLRLPWLAFLEVVFLWAVIYLTINEFKKINPTAALLLVPYLLWVTFASILNYAVAFLN